MIADEQTIFRESLQAFLGQTPGIEVTGTAADGETALDLVRQLGPDILLMELSLPRRDGLEILRELQTAKHLVRPVLLCGSITTEETVRAVRLGARGIVIKSEPTASLMDCIRKVIHGEYCMGDHGVVCLLAAVTEKENLKTHPRNKYGLTAREFEILVAVLEGYSNPEIADKFGRSEQTVKHHLSHIFDKLGVYSRLELALFAVNHRLLDEDS